MFDTIVKAFGIKCHTPEYQRLYRIKQRGENDWPVEYAIRALNEDVGVTAAEIRPDVFGIISDDEEAALALLLARVPALDSEAKDPLLEHLLAYLKRRGVGYIELLEALPPIYRPLA